MDSVTPLPSLMSYDVAGAKLTQIEGRTDVREGGNRWDSLNLSG